MTNNGKKYSLDALLELSGGDEGFYHDMIRTFLRTTRQSLEAMQQATQEENWTRVRDLAHKMRGPCTHLSTEKLSQLLAQIEEDILAGRNSAGIPKLVYEAVAEGKLLADEMRADTGLEG